MLLSPLWAPKVCILVCMYIRHKYKYYDENRKSSLLSMNSGSGEDPANSLNHWSTANINPDAWGEKNSITVTVNGSVYKYYIHCIKYEVYSDDLSI